MQIQAQNPQSSREKIEEMTTDHMRQLLALREQQQLARKKRKLDEEKEENGDAGSAPAGILKGLGKPIGKLKLEPRRDDHSVQEPEKDDGSGMPSPPESF